MNRWETFLYPHNNWIWIEAMHFHDEWMSSFWPQVGWKSVWIGQEFRNRSMKMDITNILYGVSILWNTVVKPHNCCIGAWHCLCDGWLGVFWAQLAWNQVQILGREFMVVGWWKKHEYGHKCYKIWCKGANNTVKPHNCCIDAWHCTYVCLMGSCWLQLAWNKVWIGEHLGFWGVGRSAKTDMNATIYDESVRNFSISSQ